MVLRSSVLMTKPSVFIATKKLLCNLHLGGVSQHVCYGQTFPPQSDIYRCKLSNAQNDSSIQKLLCSLFVLCLCMFVWLRVQGFESSVNKVFQKEKLINSKTRKDIQSSKRKLVQQELTWFNRQGPSLIEALISRPLFVIS